jgi:3-methyladenine DNA glycosylase AlkD
MKKSGSTISDQPASAMTVERAMDELRRRGSPKAVVGMARFGIQTGKALGVSSPQLREVARQVGTNHELAQKLWKTGIHEALILASMIDDPEKVSENQMEGWATDFDSWDVVDGCCGNLFDKTEFAIRKAHEWSKRKEEYVKRAGFVLIAEMAVHDKNASDKTFLDFFQSLLERPQTNAISSRKL